MTLHGQYRESIIGVAAAREGSLSAAYTVEAVVNMLRQLVGMQQQRIAITAA